MPRDRRGIFADGESRGGVIGDRIRNLGSSENALARRAAENSSEQALELAADVVAYIDALAAGRDPIRIQSFSARVLGSNKALRPGTDAFRFVCSALVDHDPHTRCQLDEQGVPPRRATEIARDLEVNGVYGSSRSSLPMLFWKLPSRITNPRGHCGTAFDSSSGELRSHVDQWTRCDRCRVAWRG